MMNKMNPQRFEQSYLMSKTPYFSGWKSAKIIMNWNSNPNSNGPKSNRYVPGLSQIHSSSFTKSIHIFSKLVTVKQSEVETLRRSAEIVIQQYQTVTVVVSHR